MAQDKYIDLRFSSINDWCVRSGIFTAGWPNFHSAVYDGIRYYGHYLIKDPVVDWEDVPAHYYGAQDMRTKFTGAHDYAVREGYQHGFPNGHQADHGQGLVYGTFLIVPGTCEWRDVPGYMLGLGHGDPSAQPMDYWFMGASDFAAQVGYPAAMPNGHYAHNGNTWVCGVFLFYPGTVEWRDISHEDLRLPYEIELELGPGWGW